jgi:hypothetical protein
MKALLALTFAAALAAAWPAHAQPQGGRPQGRQQQQGMQPQKAGNGGGNSAASVWAREHMERREQFTRKRDSSADLLDTSREMKRGASP